MPRDTPAPKPESRAHRRVVLAALVGLASFMTSAGVGPLRSLARAEAPFAAPPKGNRPGPRSPGERPAPGDVTERVRLLFEAIQKDDPRIAEPVFFPRAAFSEVKAMPKPERYYDRLHARFHTDIHALHARLPELARAELVGVELGRRGGWVMVGEEGNRLPYWAARHASLRYRVNGAVKSLELRVLITWDDRWYVIHLNDF
jgi:hypothetical protein